jgi:AraC-like DNA-binding protein
MRRVVFSTDNVPEAERFAYWRETSEQLVGVSYERAGGRETPFSSRVEGSLGPAISRFRYCGDAVHGFRRPREIARVGLDDYVWVYREYSIGARVGHGRGEFVTKRGDLRIFDSAEPWVVEPFAHYDHDTWLFPRKFFEPHLRESQRSPLLVLRDGSSLAGMVKAYLDAFAGQLDALDQSETGLIADNFCRLLAVACGAPAGEHQEAVRLARLEQAKRYIDLHLADPEMTPQKVAAALNMPVRQLHLLFEPSGTSFSQYVLRRRLEECRAALLNPVGDRSVTDIALGFGFNSLWTFNRTFRRAFGITPSEARGGAAAPRSIG